MWSGWWRWWIGILLCVPQLGKAAEGAYCFVPGMGGATTYIFQDVRRELNARGIPFVGIDIGADGSIQERSHRLAKWLEHQWARDPDFRCDLIGHSLGGLVIRYAINHERIRHPQRGLVSLREAVRSAATVSTPHRGTPYGDVMEQNLPFWDPALNQLSESAIRIFNDSAFPETYSPVPEGLPFFSYRSYMQDVGDALDWLGVVGFNWMSWMLQGRSLEGRMSDGLVPLASQSFGKVVADLRRPHAYFSDPTPVKPPVADFYEQHWRFLQEELP